VFPDTPSWQQQTPSKNKKRWQVLSYPKASNTTNHTIALLPKIEWFTLQKVMLAGMK